MMLLGMAWHTQEFMKWIKQQPTFSGWQKIFTVGFGCKDGMNQVGLKIFDKLTREFYFSSAKKINH